MKQIFIIGLFSLLWMSCKKDQETPLPQDTFLKIDDVVFNTRSSNDLKGHAFNIDTLNHTPYTLQGFGVFTGKSRTVRFSGGGHSKGVPVIAISGWDDYGYTYIAKDTSGNIMEIYRNKFDSSRILFALPITMLAAKKIVQGDEWISISGWEQGRNTLYFRLNTKILSTNATTSHGIDGCIVIEYSAPDYTDTLFFKPGKGPVEVLSWRAHLYEDNQPGYGGYR